MLAKKGAQIPGDWAVDEHRQVLHDAQTVEDNLTKIAFSENRPGGGVLTLGTAGSQFKLQRLWQLTNY